MHLTFFLIYQIAKGKKELITLNDAYISRPKYETADNDILLEKNVNRYTFLGLQFRKL